MSTPDGPLVLEFSPQLAAGPFRFGATRDESRAAAAENGLGELAELADRDAYLANAVQVHFDGDGLVEFVEVFAHGGVDVAFGEVLLLDTEDKVLRRALEPLVGKPDKGNDDYPAVYSYPAIDLVLWREAAPKEVSRDEREAAKKFSTVGMSRPGYRDPQPVDLPVGVAFALDPGVGVGPFRLGASLEDTRAAALAAGLGEAVDYGFDVDYFAGDTVNAAYDDDLVREITVEATSGIPVSWGGVSLLTHTEADLLAAMPAAAGEAAVGATAVSYPALGIALIKADGGDGFSSVMIAAIRN